MLSLNLSQYFYFMPLCCLDVGLGINSLMWNEYLFPLLYDFVLLWFNSNHIVLLGCHATMLTFSSGSLVYKVT